MSDDWEDDAPCTGIQPTISGNRESDNGYETNNQDFDNDGDNQRGGFKSDFGSRNRDRDGFKKDYVKKDFGSGGGRRRFDDEEGGGGRRRFDDEEGGGGRRRFDGERGGGGRRRFDDEEGGGDRRRRNDGGDDNGWKKDNRGDENGFHSEKPKEFYIPPESSTDESVIFQSGISSGINFAKYDTIEVKVSGANPPEAINSFDSAGFGPLLMDNIEKSGYTKPTPIQKYAIPAIQAGRDLMACAQTGSGKTAAFLLPMIDYLIKNNVEMNIGSPNVVIISPTRELAIQIYEEARKFSYNSILKTCILYGGTATRHQNSQVARGCHILVATPGRLLDFVNKGIILFDKIKFVVLDEADRMLDMGFKPDIDRMMNNETMPGVGEKLMLMFSATFPEEIQRMAGQFLNNYLFLTVGIVGGACSDVTQEFLEVTRFSKRGKLKDLLKEESRRTRVLVFVETKKCTDFLASLLSESQIPTTSIHGDRLQSEREMALNDFKRGKMQVLIATNVAARGLDIKGVDLVINYDLPKSIDEYVHRIGRTGRVGNKGRAISFFDPEQDGPLVPDLLKILGDSDQTVPEFISAAGSGIGMGIPSSNFEDVRGKLGGLSLTGQQEPEKKYDDEDFDE